MLISHVCFPSAIVLSTNFMLNYWVVSYERPFAFSRQIWTNVFYLYYYFKLGSILPLLFYLMPQVLDELNLSMEAMIMPVAPGEQLTADLLSPASSSIDSGFSSSSTGTNSLGRPQPTKRKSPGGFWRRLPALVKSREPPSQPSQLHPPHSEYPFYILLLLSV